MPVAMKTTTHRAVLKSPTVTSPFFTKALNDIDVKSLGGCVKLECHVEGYPKPEVLWQKAGKTVGKSRNVHMTRSGNRCILEISSIRESDLGTYECIAVNISGTSTTRGTLSQPGKDSNVANARSCLTVSSAAVMRSRSAERNSQSLPSAQRSPSSCRKRITAADSPSSNGTTRAEVQDIRRNRSPGRNNDTDSPKPSRNPSPNVFGRKVISKVKIPDVFKKDGSIEKSPRTLRKNLNSSHNAVNGHTHSPSDKSSVVARVTNVHRDKTDCRKNYNDSQDRDGASGVSRTSPGFLNKFPEHVNGSAITTNSEKEPIAVNKSVPPSDRETLGLSRTKESNHVDDSLAFSSNSEKRPNFEQNFVQLKPILNGRTNSPLKPLPVSSQPTDLVPDLAEPALTKFWPELPADKPLKSTASVQLSLGAPKPLSALRYPRRNYEQHWNDEMIRVKIPDDKAPSDRSKGYAESDGTSVRPPSAGSVPPSIIAVTTYSSPRRQSDCSNHEEKNVRIAVQKPPGSERSSLHLSEAINADEARNAAHGRRNSNDFWDVSGTPAATAKNSCTDQGSLTESSELKPSLNMPYVQIPDIQIHKSQKDDMGNEHYFETSSFGHDDIMDLAFKKPATSSLRRRSEDLGLTSSWLRDQGDVGFAHGTSDSANDFIDTIERARTGEPDIDQNAPARINRGPQSVTVLRGESVTLAIHFSGRPQPSVLWMKGGTVLRDGGRHSILVGQDMSALSVREVTADDSGKYVVSVNNENGGDSCFASVAVVGIPEPPGGEPTASEFTDHSLVLSWYGSMYDGGSVVTGYVVEMCTVPDMRWQKVAHSVNTSCEVQGLSCGQQYIFRVRAENRYGGSPPSRESQTICLDDYIDGEAFRDENVEVQSPPVSIESGSLFTERYELKEEVGKGRFGTVFRCVEKSTGRPRAAKIIRCIRGKDKVLQEIDIMNKLHHPKLLKLLAAFENGRNMVLVTEYISGGELFERVIAHDFVLTECDCVLFVRQICDAVAYMHRCSVLHLDLKPENILCKTKTSHQIKIIDFGLAKMFKPDDNLRVLFGTPEFVAPEVIGYEPVGPPSDMWSVGVICYVLLSGLSPFMGDTDPETFANITRAQFDFDEEAFANISNEAKDFISRLLIKLPKRRMTAEECLKHPWLMRISWMNDRGAPLSTEKLKKFIIRRKWQKSGTAIRALGRMVTLSKSSQSSCETPPPVGSPPSLRSRVARSETTDSGDSEVFRDSDSIDLSR